MAAQSWAGIAVLGTVISGLAGCESKLASLSDRELQDRIYECNAQRSQSPGFAISCDNYRRECENRRDAGHYVC
jgi:hypothetical protein